MVSTKRSIRIAGVSGGVFDRFRAIEDFAKDPTIDVIFGDWISEVSMTLRGAQKLEGTKSGMSTEAYEQSFITMLSPGIQNIAKHGQKVAVNAGACDAEAMAKRIQQLCKNKGTELRVSWVTGDNVTDQFQKLLQSGEKFLSLPADTPIQDWGAEPIFAQAYLGGIGIAEALRRGADIVICGRVSDASPVIGAAMWWHNWARDDFTKLANALVAGHLIECSSYITGGAYTGFKKELLHSGNNFTNLGFPIAEISADGQVVITKEQNTGGLVTTDTVTAQLLYEIQGPLYYNSDVTACLDKISLVQESADRVRIEGVQGLPPPPTTKIGITAQGGWQAEFHYFLTGLDINEKVQMIEAQTIASMGDYRKEFTTLSFNVTGSVAENPRSLSEATVELRIFAQTRNPDMVSAGKNKGISPDHPTFAKFCIENCLQGYPGGTPGTDMRQAVGKPFFEYWVSLFPQSEIEHLVWTHDGQCFPVGAPPIVREYPRRQASYETESPVALSAWGPTQMAPLGSIVHARSGDKSSDCNVGFWARDNEEWDWLRSFLTVKEVRNLLDKEYNGGAVDRFEIQGVRAVHFLLRDHLDRGVNSSSSYDVLGKLVAEYLRCKPVAIPSKFLEKGTI
ncbi:hypothetical protein HMPREF1624_07987 [Sporothrix schenckii ATCC 58251]|uniref:DUF1446 domain-containing protein n=1 Tax=Sporothrix schenckii (strain ATCC 58251 / de Perez 2211183) TaxID=1391915 RepID=U7PKN9_SPOS1|nr:hypothetical protein HMPREF1624_07987 [Sporothrix schenckii ATCC 58251]